MIEIVMRMVVTPSILHEAADPSNQQISYLISSFLFSGLEEELQGFSQQTTSKTKDAKFLVITWSNDFVEVQQSSKVICSNVSSSEKVQMQCKKELWPGVIESVSGKLVYHSCYLKLGMILFLTIKKSLTQKHS